MKQLNLIAKTVVLSAFAGSVMFVANPAQAFSFNFSFANVNGTPPTGGDQLVTGIISDLREGMNNVNTATVLSSPTGQLLGSYYGYPTSTPRNLVVVTNGNITSANIELSSGSGQLYLSFNPYFGPANGSRLMSFNNYTPYFSSPSAPSFSLVPPSAVPEPLTILGAMTATGFGIGFKLKLTKSQDNKKDVA